MPKVSKGNESSTKPRKIEKDEFALPIALSLLVCGFIFIGVATQQVMTGGIKIHGTTTATDLFSLPDKLKYVLKFVSVQILFLLITNANVGFNRLIHGAENPLIGRENRISAQKNILQNTLEQMVLSMATQLSLITFLTAEQTLKVIPLMNFLWVFGRVFFILGYPNKRSFGFSITFFPTVAAVIFITYKFLEVEYGLKSILLDFIKDLFYL